MQAISFYIKNHDYNYPYLRQYMCLLEIQLMRKADNPF